MESKSICEHAADVRIQFEKLLQAAQTDHASAPSQRAIHIEEHYGRFNIWAGSVGVFARGHASLDYRLRTSPDVSNLVIQLLSTTNFYIENTIFALADLDTQGSSKSAEAVLEDCLSSHASSDSSSFHLSDFDDSVGETVTLSPVEEELQGIERTINRLHRAARLIRATSIYQSPKAHKLRILDEEGNDVTENFEAFVSKILRHRLGNVSDELRSRLTSTICLRRKRFLQRMRHEQKLSVDSGVGRGNSSSLGVSPLKIAMASNGADTTGLDDILKPKPKPVTILSPTSASDFSRRRFPIDPMDLKFDSSSKISTAVGPIKAQSSGVQVPPPPEFGPGGKEFQCPYCCNWLPIKEAQVGRWSSHVMQDLEPYVCLFEPCSNAFQTFHDESEWRNHMSSQHSLHWVCSIDKLSFNSSEDLEHHLRLRHHKALTDAQIPLIARKSVAPKPLVVELCPFCAKSGNEIGLHLHQKQMADRGRQLRFSGRKPDNFDMLGHIGEHLQELAMISLPWRDDIDEKASDGRTASPRSLRSQQADTPHKPSSVESSKSIRQHSSIDFNQLEEDSASSVYNDNTQLGIPDSVIRNDDFVQVPIDDMSRGEARNEWDFIGEQPYTGHDRDPVLQAFLRKLYLEKSSDLETSQAPILPCFLGPDNKHQQFFGRENVLLALKRALCTDPGSSQDSTQSHPFKYPRAFALRGPGGMGKTQIAAEFAIRCKNRFDAVFWFHADDAPKLAHDFRNAAIKLGLASETSMDAQDHKLARELLKKWLIHPSRTMRRESKQESAKASWLLVFDGADDVKVLNEFWPYGGPGAVLITSRNSYPGASSYDLQPFNLEEAADFLLNLTGREKNTADRDGALQVAGRLGGLPLALRQMASIIKTRQMSFEDFIQAYDKRESQEELLKTQLDSYRHSVASVFALENLSEGGTTLLNMLSMFDPDGIPESFFDKRSTRQLRAFPEFQNAFSQARRDLLDASLISEEKGTGKIYIHRLVQDVARMRMSTITYRNVFMACVKLISGVWPFELLTGWRHSIARWPQCDELIPHIHHLRDLSSRVQISQEDPEGDFDFAKLLIDAGWYLHERGYALESAKAYDIAESISETLITLLQDISHTTSASALRVGAVDALLAEIQHNRGCIATETNEPKLALDYLQRFNSVMLKELGDKDHTNDMRLAISWNELGNAYMLNDRWTDGEECFLQSIRAMKRVEGYEKTMISLPIVNLGLANWLTDRYDDAIIYLKGGLEDREARFGKDDKESFITGRFLHAIGNVYFSLGQLDQSMMYHKRALMQYKSTVGDKHHRTADTCIKVADHYLRLGQNDIAKDLIRHAISAYVSKQNSLQLYRPEKARAHYKLAYIYREMDRDPEADEELREAYRLYRELRPKDHRNAEELTDKDFDAIVVFWSR